jgi:lysophospholipase L1-like esterase
VTTPLRQIVRSLRILGLLAMGLSTVACRSGSAPVTIVPRPRADDWWLDVHRRHVERAKQGRVDLLFLGDSITQGWNGNEVWKRLYEPRNAVNFGINGDATQHVLWRLRNGELDGIAPKVVVLLVGTNNLSYCTPVDIERGVAAIIEEIRLRSPKSRVVLLGILPRGQRPGPVRDKLREVNARLARLDDVATVRFLDISPSFVNGDGTISSEIMPDYLHLSVNGYRICADAMEPTLRSMLGEPR